MKICQLARLFGISNGHPWGGGVVHVAYYLAKHMAELGHDASIMCGGKPAGRLNVDGVRVTRTGEPFQIRSIPTLFEQRFDIVHSHYLLATSQALLRFTTRYPKLVVHVHQPGGQPRAEISVPRLVLKAADIVIAPSEFVRGRLMDFYDLNSGKVRVIPNGVDTSLFKPAQKEASILRNSLGLEECRVVLYLGHFENKGLENLLLALPTVLQQDSKVVLVLAGFVGSGYRSRLSNLVHSLGIEENVRFLPFIPHSRLPALYSMADLFVHPSVFEAFGMTILEAMACEKPVIAVNIDPFTSIIEPGVNGVLIANNTPTLLADSILTLLTSPDLAEKMGRAGREIAERTFQWRFIAQKLLSLYKQL